MRKDTSFSDRKLTREEFSHKYWKDGEHPYQYHTAEIEDGRDEREQFLINQCRALYGLYRHTYKVFPTRTDLWEEKQTSRTRYRFILVLIGLILLIAGISANWLAWRRNKKNRPRREAEGDNVTENYLRYLFGPEHQE